MSMGLTAVRPSLEASHSCAGAAKSDPCLFRVETPDDDLQPWPILQSLICAYVCEQEKKITEADLQPQKPLWHEDTRGPRRNHPQNLVLTDAAQRMVHFNVQVCMHAMS